jgi:hypothetical protein
MLIDLQNPVKQYKQGILHTWLVTSWEIVLHLTIIWCRHVGYEELLNTGVRLACDEGVVGSNVSN